MEMNRILNKHVLPAMNHTTYTAQSDINLSLKIGPYEILKCSEVGHQESLLNKHKKNNK